MRQSLREHPRFRNADQKFVRALSGVRDPKTMVALMRAHEDAVCATQRITASTGTRAIKFVSPRV
jgi:hypothetical protein